MQRGSKTDEIITIVFMAFAVIAVVCLFLSNDRIYAMSFAGVAIIIRVIQYILRFFK